MRKSFRYLTAAVSMLALAACGDTTAPSAASSTRTLSASGPAFDYGNTSRSFGQQSMDFTVGSSAQHVDVNGLFALDFPDGSCPMSASSSSCENSITVHAVTRLTAGGVVVDFSPHLTFAKAVTLSTSIFAPVLKMGRTYFAAHPSSLNALALYYSPSLSSAPVADFDSDRSLITHVNLKTGLVYRSIWHF
ncbi:MAG: hypothetical protein ABI205_10660, partial [Gemmatimonadaceae bacterium]